MLAEKLCALKEAVLAAQSAFSKMLVTLPLSKSDSNDIMEFLSEALDTILETIEEPSSEKRLLLLAHILIDIGKSISILIMSPNLNISGVLFKSTLNDLKKVAKVVNTAKRFAMLSKDEEDPNSSDNIGLADKLTDACLNAFSRLEKIYKDKETIVELANALKVSCSAITCLATNVAMNYAWRDDCILDKLSNRCKLSN